MATAPTNTGGGTIVSFSNTPQATDDLFLASKTGLTEDLLGTVFLDVMGNDLGGAAKILYSLDNDVSLSTATTIYAPVDLLTQDTARTESLSTDISKNGAKIWITPDGKVGYDASFISDTFRATLQALGAGVFATDTFTYAIRLANGTLSWATATVQFAGVNDAATISVVGLSDNSVTEKGGLNNGTGGDASASGQLSVSDLDTGQNIFQSPATLAGTYGTFTFNATSGVWTYLLDDTRAATQGLNAGVVVTDTLNRKICGWYRHQGDYCEYYWQQRHSHDFRQ